VKPVKYTTFVRRLGVQLTPAQFVLTTVAYDGVDPIDLPPKQREIARSLFGAVDRIPQEARSVLVAVCGARAGKSYVLCALRLLHLAMTVSLDPLAYGEAAVGLIVAPDMRLGRQTLRFAWGAAKKSPEIAQLVQSDSADSFTIDRDGRAVRLEVLPATRGGSAVRGRSLAGAVLDECAFFRDENYTVNDAEIFRAVAPRILNGGQLIVASTPWAEGGLLYELFRDNHGDPDTALAVHAPTLVMRDDRATIALVHREQRRDPDNAAREFGAEFMTTGSGLFLDGAAVDRAVDETLICAGGLS
jgi:hypothetical protein